MKTFPLSYQFTSERLRFRAPQPSDAQYTFTASRYPGFNDGMLWEPPETIEEVAGSLERNIAAWKSGGGYAFAFETLEGAFVGRISLRYMQADQVWDIGYWAHPEQQGNGYMTEAVAAILDQAFRVLGVPSVRADYAVWNEASKGVLHKNGFQFVEHIAQGFQKRGEWVAENRVQITRERWETVRLVRAAEAVTREQKLADHNNAGTVGAALLGANGKIYTGVCIDTSSSMGFCAEHNAIGSMITDQEQQIVRVVAVWKNEAGATCILHPCGRCREFMRQIHPQNLQAEIILGPERIVSLAELLPYQADYAVWNP